MCVVINIIFIKINSSKKGYLFLQFIFFFCEKIQTKRYFCWIKKGCEKIIQQKHVSHSDFVFRRKIILE